jgi:hypothetical protein
MLFWTPVVHTIWAGAISAWYKGTRPDKAPTPKPRMNLTKVCYYYIEDIDHSDVTRAYRPTIIIAICTAKVWMMTPTIQTTVVSAIALARPRYAGIRNNGFRTNVWMVTSTMQIITYKLSKHLIEPQTNIQHQTMKQRHQWLQNQGNQIPSAMSPTQWWWRSHLWYSYWATIPIFYNFDHNTDLDHILWYKWV